MRSSTIRGKRAGRLGRCDILLNYETVSEGGGEQQKMQLYGKIARQDGSLGETLERNLLRFHSKGFKGNNPKGSLPRNVALIMMLRNSKVLEREPS